MKRAIRIIIAVCLVVGIGCGMAAIWLSHGTIADHLGETAFAVLCMGGFAAIGLV